ncbi:copper homeostasis protein CutC [Arcticibacter tournemirensis]|uniref:PF03932 family protein CutC n=1 Tax=Arcticibacter tournemirensis TaxID=699437 RepID=A0A4Q0M970_9SPHI|nr:copper homeostasis protein CutC [Arcticibacter tournemirensis]RXF69717.1 copper homeostasis protein CutC [Arcticibacter tournemirensis]
MDYKLEICANSIESALAAQSGGADRIELCDNMSEGGTTPSYGTIKRCKDLLGIPVFPIIRPRGGDFVYTEEEFEVMKADVQMSKDLGCEGVVLGILTRDGNIDVDRCSELITLARPMQVTFHRAFDCCIDMKKGLEDIISLGCERVLTSGGAAHAYDGVDVIKDLVEQAHGRVIVMAGSGLDASNIRKMMGQSRVREFHSTAKSIVQFQGIFNNNAGISPSFYQTDQRCVQILKSLMVF